MEYYLNSTEFLLDVAAVSKKILKGYISRITLESKDNDIYKLRGRVIFARDIIKTEYNNFTDEEIKEYDSVQEKNLEEIKRIREKCTKSAENKVIIPFMYLINKFKCNDFETMILFQLLTAEYDAEISKSFQIIMNDNNAFTPSIELCAAMLTIDENRQKEIIAGEYQRIKLLELFLDSSFSEEIIRTNLIKPLRLNKRIIDFSLNMNSNSEYVNGAITMIWPWTAQNEESFLDENYVEKMIEYSKKNSEKKIYALVGSEGAGKHFQLKQFSKKSKTNIVLVNVDLLSEDKKIFEDQVKNIMLEVMIRNAVVAFENVDLEQKNYFVKRINYVLEKVFELSNQVFLLMDNFAENYANAYVREKIILINLDEITDEDRLSIWKHCLKEKIFSKISIENMAEKFDFTPGRIINSVNMARKKMLWENMTEVDENFLTKCCYNQVSHKLSDKAVKLEAKYSWEDLILSDKNKEMLKNACNQVKFRHVVYNNWGFASKNHYGRGVSMLFYGPPGTGKTMTAQVIANELNMEIYKVDLSTVMSKYIGEAEKNLSVIFDEVKKSNSILFFDEADALFGKRTETKEANDKYANAETAYLLQKMEEYSGIVILATNYMQNFDEAYKRRIKFMVHFSFPNISERKMLWKSCFSSGAPVDNIDYDFLAEKFEMAGSHIKNVVINAAFMAASKNKPIGMEEIIISLKNENEKYGKILSKEDVGDYFYLL